ncbi:hypothetical protein L596_009056 [Steinernema carpocapsae]|uniref:Uncharacterized protein n=1 Tax=Steinernema carpocapsae TaxID=34508 RepID=A0A4U5PF35_STECR|nr:hypothetical protein L596_009056 [Steinernema carpocapsae]
MVRDRTSQRRSVFLGFLYSELANTPVILSTTNDFHVFDVSKLKKRFSAQTFKLGSNRSTTTFWPSNANATPLHMSFSADLSEPFVSSTGAVTIVRIPEGGKAFPTFFVKLYDEKRECFLVDLLIYSNSSFSSHAKKGHLGQTHCPTYVFTRFPAMQFIYENLNTNSSVKVISKLDILRKVNHGTIGPKQPKDTLNGLFMSPGYPSGSSNISFVKETLTILPYSKENLERTVTIAIEGLTPKSKGESWF